MDKEKVNELLGVVNGFSKSIQSYDSHFNMKCEHEHDCIMAGYRDSAFGILFSLLTLNQITCGEFHRRLHELNCALYKRID